MTAIICLLIEYGRNKTKTPDGYNKQEASLQLKGSILSEKSPTMINHSKRNTLKNHSQSENHKQTKKFLFCIFWDAGSLSSLSVGDISLIAPLATSENEIH